MNWANRWRPKGLIGRADANTKVTDWVAKTQGGFPRG